MPAATRTDALLKGKEVLMMIEKVFGSGSFVPYACMSSANITNPGTATEKIACRAGTFVQSAGEPEPPTVALESLIRYITAAGDVANNVTDMEIWDWVVSGEKKNVKLLFGSKAGDMVLTGPGFFNQQSLNGPQDGQATGGVTFNFSEFPTRTATV